MYVNRKDLAKRIILGRILNNDRAHENSLNPKSDEYQRGVANLIYRLFDKKTELAVNVDELLALGLHKPMIKKFKRRKTYSKFKGNL